MTATRSCTDTLVTLWQEGVSRTSTLEGEAFTHGRGRETPRRAAGRVPRRCWGVARLLVGAVMLVSVSGGTCNGKKSPPLDPVPARIEIVPSHVIVAPSSPLTATTFQLEARLREADGTLIATWFGYEPVWETAADDAWLALTPLSRHRVSVTVLPAAPDVDWTTTIRATVDRAANVAEATLEVRQEPVSTADDRVERAHSPGAAPSVVLVDGAGQSSLGIQCLNDSTVAFVRVGFVGDLIGGCSAGAGIAVFSPDRGAVIQPFPWSTGAQTVSISPLQDPERNVELAIWVAIDPADLPAGETTDDVWLQARAADVPRANTILADARAGIELTVFDPGDIDFDPALSPADRAVIGTNCEVGLGADLSALAGFEPGKLNVYYVDRVGAGTAFAGAHCPREDGERVVYVAYNAFSASTLAHEMGHAFGLLWPQGGHPYYPGCAYGSCRIAGFDSRNLMASGLDDETAGIREHLSLGQVFRMNAEALSWVGQTTAPAAELACQCSPYARTPCPGLAEDLGPPPASTEQIPSWKCFDHFKLVDTDLTHAGTAFAAGRLFGTGPGDCQHDIPGGTRYDDGRLNLLFPNLTAPMACPLDVFVFLDHRVPFVWTLTPTFAQVSHEIEWPPVDLVGLPGPALQVPVYLWFVGEVDFDVVEADRDAAEVAYEVSRTGIEFDWRERNVGAGTETELLALLTELGGSPCAPTTSAFTVPDAINVYYVSAGFEAGTGTDFGYLWPDHGASCWAGGGTWHLVLPAPGHSAHTSTALGHHLGHVFSLAHVGSADGLDDANMMFPTLAPTRKAFTPGQAFRMHFEPLSWLNQSSLSPRPTGAGTRSCAVDPGRCPGIAAPWP